MTKEIVATKSQLVSDVQAEFSFLSRLIEGIQEVDLLSHVDPQGWNVKDHIAHLTGWVRLVLFFFQGKPPHIALGVDQAVYERGTSQRNYDQINEDLREQTREAPVGEVVKDFRRTHGELVRLLETLNDADFQLPYRHYLPQEPGAWPDTLAMNVAYGNSAHHYKEHREWIQSLIDRI